MNCRQVINQINKYYDQQVLLSTRNEIDNHLNSCCDCRDKYEAHKAIINLLNIPHSLRAPEGLTDRIMNSILDVNVKNSPYVSIINHSHGIVFKRMGFSMVFAAFLLFFTLNFSVITSNVSFSRSENMITNKSTQISDSFLKFNNKVSGFFNIINHSIGEGILGKDF